jgi:hypothetical protein
MQGPSTDWAGSQPGRPTVSRHNMPSVTVDSHPDVAGCPERKLDAIIHTGTLSTTVLSANDESISTKYETIAYGT